MATNLAKIVRAAAPGTGVQLRPEPYGKNGIRQFLRDVVAMANASVDGPRYIIVGAEIDKKGNKRLATVSRDDFSGKPSYQGLVTDFIEPPIRLKYQPASVDGKRVGVFEISDCQDRPYMMRVDYSEKLRRGDAYIRVDDMPVKMGRRQLQEMFERKFHDLVSANRIEGVVVSPSGSPVSGAVVVTGRTSRPFSETVSDDRGQFALPWSPQSNSLCVHSSRGDVVAFGSMLGSLRSNVTHA